MSSVLFSDKMIDDRAAEWAVRLDLRPLGLLERAELDEWLSQDGRHVGALLRAQATLAYVDRAQPAAVDIPVAQTDGDQPFGSSRRRFLRFAGGGAIAAAAGLAVMILPREDGQELSTGIGEVRRVSLADGSIAVLNTASRVAVSLQPTQRAIRLEQGEAWFQVAHDEERPFVVQAGTLRVRAVGTAFGVRRHEGGSDLLVSEGVVEWWLEGQEVNRRRLEAGDRTFVGTEPSLLREIAPVTSTDMEELQRGLAWRDGDIILKGETVDYAVAELNRYNRRRIVVTDPQIGRERLVGYFRTNDPANFARAVVQMTGARMSEDESEIRLTRQ